MTENTRESELVDERMRFIHEEEPVFRRPLDEPKKEAVEVKKKKNLEKFWGSLMLPTPEEEEEVSEDEIFRMLWEQIGKFEKWVLEFQEEAEPVIAKIIERITEIVNARMGPSTVKSVFAESC